MAPDGQTVAPQSNGPTTAGTATSGQVPEAAGAAKTTVETKAIPNRSPIAATGVTALGVSPAASEDVQALARLSASASPGNVGYKIGPHDVLDVTVFKVPDLSKTVQVAEAGAISMPLIGDIQAIGRTSQDVEREISKKLGAKYLQNPQVSVFVKEFNSQRVTIEGAVRKSGVFPLKGRTTLMQVIAMSEGIDDQLASGTIIVFRQKGKQKEAARFELDEIRSGKASDPELVTGDMVVVDTSATKKAFNNFIKVLPAASVFKLL